MRRRPCFRTWPFLIFIAIQGGHVINPVHKKDKNSMKEEKEEKEMTKLFVFDFDGTVVNSWPFFVTMVQEYSAEFNLPKPCLETLRVGYGHPEDHEFWPGLPQDKQVYHLFECFKWMDDYNNPHRPNSYPEMFDNVVETFERIKSHGHRLAIVTAKPFDPLKQILDHHDIGSYFCGIRTHDDVAKRGEKLKPHPDQLISVINELGFTPEDTVVIGDTDMDVKMARAAGAKAIGVTWGNHCEVRLGDAGAHKILGEDFADIVDAAHLLFELSVVAETA